LNICMHMDALLPYYNSISDRSLNMVLCKKRGNFAYKIPPLTTQHNERNTVQ
jgi:hypothetical protein